MLKQERVHPFKAHLERLLLNHSATVKNVADAAIGEVTQLNAAISSRCIDLKPIIDDLDDKLGELENFEGRPQLSCNRTLRSVRGLNSAFFFCVLCSVCVLAFWFAFWRSGNTGTSRVQEHTPRSRTQARRSTEHSVLEHCVLFCVLAFYEACVL